MLAQGRGPKMLRSLLRSSSAAAASVAVGNRASIFLPNLLPASASSRSYSAKNKTANKGKARVKNPRAESIDETDARGEDASHISDGIDDEYERPKDPLPPSYDPALDVGPGGRPLFTMTNSFASLSRKEACTYVDFRCRCTFSFLLRWK